ncbi:hypothetical protein C8R34_11310 [Nitrosomonas sp. Nm84]|nr:hypothetical protein C8R34_11310 [Nitrosomonas sp. Nm84]
METRVPVVQETTSGPRASGLVLTRLHGGKKAREIKRNVLRVHYNLGKPFLYGDLLCQVQQNKPLPRKMPM